MKNVGKSPQRYDIPAKVDGTLKWAVDMKVPGMLHARNVRPPVAGATLVSIDESSVKDIPGFVKVVSRGNYVAVVCEREEQAIRAARQLKVEWKTPATAPFPASEDLFTYMRAATPSSTGKPVVVGDPDAAFAGAATVIEAEYDVPFQGHTAFGPAHALADPSNDQLTIYSNDMKSYGMRNGVAQFLKIPRDRVRVVWMQGPQAYGRTAADDAGFEAAFLAKEIGRPVRVQWTRQEETAWDTKGPAYAIKMRGGLDAQGKLVALDYDARAADYNHLGYNEHDTVLIAQLMGTRKRQRRPAARRCRRTCTRFRTAADHARRADAAAVGDAASHGQPARSRRPAGDVRVGELHRRARGRGEGGSGGVPAGAARGEHGGRQRLQARAIDRVHQGGGGEVRLGPAPVPNPRRGTGDISTGRGIAYAYRSQTVVAEIVEVEVNRKTGRIWVKRIVCRARLRPGDQSRGADARARERRAALAEPRAATKR